MISRISKLCFSHIAIYESLQSFHTIYLQNLFDYIPYAKNGSVQIMITFTSVSLWLVVIQKRSLNLLYLGEILDKERIYCDCLNERNNTTNREFTLSGSIDSIER